MSFLAPNTCNQPSVVSALLPTSKQYSTWLRDCMMSTWCLWRFLIHLTVRFAIGSEAWLHLPCQMHVWNGNMQLGRGYGLDVPSSGWGPSSLQWGWSCHRLHVVPRLKMSGAIPPVPPYVYMPWTFADLSYYCAATARRREFQKLTVPELLNNWPTFVYPPVQCRAHNSPQLPGQFVAPSIVTLPNLQSVVTLHNLPSVATLPNLPSVVTLPNLPSVVTLPNLPSVVTLPNSTLCSCFNLPQSVLQMAALCFSLAKCSWQSHEPAPLGKSAGRCNRDNWLVKNFRWPRDAV